MKVLFAVNNESISESIIKKYQQEYKEIISSKNVYYFDAITRELQKDKTYDRIVISEDVEPFANNNYGVIDKFIFERLDSISDEATTNSGQDIPIILICADRRTKSENILVKLFGIGIYSALLGQDRTISKVCELINKPRSKKDAKIYYRIDIDDVEYKAESEGDVNEIEIQNILNHYKRLGKDEEEYVRSFDNIAEQYTDAQLRVICKFLPLNVKAVLEANSQKYQELITFGTVTPSTKQANEKQNRYVPNKEYQDRKKANKKDKSSKLDIIEKNIGKSELTKPVIIPSVAGVKNQEKDSKIKNESRKSDITSQIQQMPKQPTQKESQAQQQTRQVPQVELEEQHNLQEIPEKKSNQDENEGILQSIESDMSEPKIEAEMPKRKRGRPKKIQDNIQNTTIAEQPKKKRGRPRKVENLEKIDNSEVVVASNKIDASEKEPEETVDLFNLGAEPQKNGELILPGLEEESDSKMQYEQDGELDLFNLGNDDEEDNMSEKYDDEENNMFEDYDDNQYSNLTPNNDLADIPKDNLPNDSYDYSANNSSYNERSSTREIETTNQYNPYEGANFKNLLSMSNKLVAFVGTSKNGTSFLVNSMAEILSRRGIKTAILDLTQNKNAYYIYTQNDETLRKTAFDCIENLQNGVDKGIVVNKNLTVFTTLPDRNENFSDYKNILTTLTKNYSLVLMDCDYETNYAYFDLAQEIYLVQSFDILTIQPLTAFLRNLKSKNILDSNKLRIVLNKVLRVRSITERIIIGGMSSYNDPSMSYMTELFDKDNVKYCSIPFDQEAYSKYLDGLVNCEISTKGYPKNFIASLEKLANMIYPLLNNDKPANKFNAYNQNTSNFSSNMNETLNKMKNRY